MSFQEIHFNHILLVEDDPRLCHTLSQVLNGYCQTFKSCDSISVARQYLQEFTPDLVIVDFQLSDGTLFDIQLKDWGGMEVIAMSAIASPEETFKLAQIGVQQFLSKPFSLLTFEQALSNAFHRLKGSPIIHINTFGGLQLTINREPVFQGRKSPYKLMALLKAIIALGGVNVPTDKVCDWLWEEDFGDVASSKLHTYLHRLRRLLGPAAIICRDNLISLNQDLIRLDVWEVMQCLEQGMALSMNPKSHYEKPWLPGDESPWLIQPRVSMEQQAQKLVSSK